MTLRTPLRDLVGRIQQQHAETDQTRAVFLWNLFAKYNDKPIDSSALYLDIGARRATNAEVFRNMMRCKFAVAIDIDFTRLFRDNKCSSGLMLVLADAQKLPFREGCFDLITMFSLIEHVQRPEACISEAFHAVKNEGQLFMQFPNRYFPVEFHSGLPLYFYLPKRLREWLAVKKGAPWMKDVDVPSTGMLRRYLETIQPPPVLNLVGFHYPRFLLPKSRTLSFFYWLMSQLHVFRILPMGYVALCSKRTGVGGKDAR